MANLADLAFGNGEWRNMQEVVRKTFKAILEKQQQQSEQTANLSLQVVKLKEELSRRPTWEDVENLVTMKSTHDRHLASHQSRPLAYSTSVSDLDDMKLQIAKLQSDSERRVTVQSLQAALNRKADKVDLQSLKESTSKVLETPQEISKMKLDVADIRNQLENLSEQVEQTAKIAGVKNTMVDMSIVRVQLESLFRKVHEDIYTREEIQSIISDKVGKTDIDKLIAGKMDKSTHAMSLTKVEEVLAEHERQITAMRISVGDPSLFSADFLSKKGPVLPVVEATSSNSDHSTSQAAGTSRATSSKRNSIANPSGHHIRNEIQESKLESILSGLWNKMNAVVKEYKHIRDDSAVLRKDVATLKEQMHKVAAADKVEVLAVVVEEQRLRIDSVVQGSTKIYPIYKELKKMDANLREINGFLSLPQPSNLRSQLHEMSLLMEDLSKRLVELSSEFHSQHANKLDSLSSKTDLLEARLETCLVDRERIAFLMDHTDISASRFSNILDIARSLNDLWQTLLSEPTFHEGDGDPDSVKHDKSRTESSSRSIVSRLKTVEQALHGNDQDHIHLQHRIDLLKEALVSFGLQIDLPSTKYLQHQHQLQATHKPSRSHTQHSKHALKRSRVDNHPVDSKPPALTRPSSASTAEAAVEEAKDVHQDVEGKEGRRKMLLSDFNDDDGSDADGVADPSPITATVEDADEVVSPTLSLPPSPPRAPVRSAHQLTHKESRHHQQHQHQHHPQRGPRVDYDAALDTLYASLEEIAVPIRVPITSPLRQRFIPSSSAMATANPGRYRDDEESSRGSDTTGGGGSEMMLVSLTEVDERLAALQREKLRLRTLLINRV